MVEDEKITKVDFDEIRITAESLKNTLRKFFGIIYIDAQNINERDQGISSELKGIDQSLLEIEKDKNPIYFISSKEDVNERKKEILGYWDKLIDQMLTLLDKVDDQLDDGVLKSIEIIIKSLTASRKKTESAFNRFKIDETWVDVNTIQQNFSYTVVGVLENMLNGPLDSILAGMETNSVYEELLSLLNDFLATLGIYTYSLKLGQKIKDDEMDWVSPQSGDEDITNHKAKVGCLRSIQHPAYLFGDCDKEVVVLEAKVTVWRSQ